MMLMRRSIAIPMRKSLFSQSKYFCPLFLENSTRQKSTLTTIKCVGKSMANQYPLLSLVSKFPVRFNSTEKKVTNEQDVKETETNEVVGEKDKVTSSSSSTSSSEKNISKFDPDEYDDYEYEEPKTAKEKVWFYGTFAIRLLMLGAAIGCLVVFLREVFPGRMGPNSLFSEAFDTVQVHDNVREVTGLPMKAYGRDVGRNEGRRNHVDSRQYDEPMDGSKRTRIRFMVEGPRGKVRVWTEISNKMNSGEYVYLICKDMQNGRIITIIDNRDRLETEAASGGNADSKNAIFALLSGGNQK